MKNGVKLLVAFVVVAAVVITAVIVSGDNSESKTTKKTNTSSNSETDDTTAPATATITYTDDGFSPATLTVASGDTVKFINDTDSTIEPASAPHPIHTDNPQLNVGDIEPGESKTVKLTTTGTWSYHNHYNHDKQAQITVQ